MPLPQSIARLSPARLIVLPCLLSLLNACGGGGGGAMATAPAPPVTTTPQTVSAADASRLLDQATFGVTAADVAHVQSIGIDAYLNEQIAAPSSQYTGYTYTPHTAPANCITDPATPTDASSICARNQYSPFQVQRDFFTHALNDSDQLRQRVAYALSQIFVVSSVEIYEAYGLAAYQSMLLKDAFGSYRTLLGDVTLSPVMGHYLDMVNNDKPNLANGTAPNENYAREALQLFSIGLYQLNADGTQQLDGSGAPIPTYTQNTIEGFSAVFTGWTYPALPGATSKWTNPINFNGVMASFADHHDDTDPKPLLNGYTVPANQTPEQDLANALDNIFNHPNVGPFIGKQLIQHLVTSNPSPAYVARVAAVFANDGTGVRGNLAAVVRAIITDAEARGDQPAGSDFGRLREPALFITSTLRSLGGQSDGVYLRSASSSMGQPIFAPETVFNFYPPTYAIPGTQTLAPEIGIDNAATALARANFLNTVIMQSGAAPDPTVPGSTGTSISLSSFASTTDAASLIAQLNQLLVHGSLASDAGNVILGAVQAVTSTDPTAPARVASYLILSSGQFQVER
jgi:uncharacterized protein (DUF1800 family)